MCTYIHSLCKSLTEINFKAFNMYTAFPPLSSYKFLIFLRPIMNCRNTLKNLQSLTNQQFPRLTYTSILMMCLKKKITKLRQKTTNSHCLFSV